MMSRTQHLETNGESPKTSDRGHLRHLRPAGSRSGRSCKRRRMTVSMKIFRCGPWCEISAWRACGPRWKISQGGSRGGWRRSMGKVRWRSGSRLSRRHCREGRSRGFVLSSLVFLGGCRGNRGVPTRSLWGFEAPGTNEFGRSRRGNRSASAWVSGHGVMRPGPLVVLGTLASGRAGRSRRRASARHSRDNVRAG